MTSEITDPIATSSFFLLRPDGTSTPVTAMVGRPYVVDGVARCPVKIEGLEDYPDAYGDDTLQAVSLALKLLHARFSHLIRSGCILTHPSDNSHVGIRGLNATFGRSAHRSRKKR